MSLFLERTYKVSYGGYRSVEYDEAYNYCNDLGLGLAVWKGVEAAADIEYLTTTFGESYTALNNENDVECHKKKDSDLDDCDGELIWRQNKDGPCELFEADAGHMNMYVCQKTEVYILGQYQLSITVK